MKKDSFKNNKKLIIFIFLFLIILTFSTKYYGHVDINDYSNVAKFFAGNLASKIRSSHSYLFGFMHSQFVAITNNLIIFKISSLIFLMLIVLSVYYISNKDKKTLWLILLSPLIWYMAPWISPIQLASLLILWGCYFIKKYDKIGNLRYLACSGIILGLGWAIYDTVLPILFFLGIIFLYNKKTLHSFYFILFLIIGLSPRLVLDQFLFNFPFYTIFKSTMGGVANCFGGIYGNAWRHSSPSIKNFFLIFLSIPFYYWRLYNPKFFKNNKKIMIFISLCLLLILFIPQIRYVLLITPVIILLLGRVLTYKQFRRQIILFFIIIILFITPYMAQTNYSINNEIYGVDFSYLYKNDFKFSLTKDWTSNIIQKNIKEIAEDYPNELFIVGNEPDSYTTLVSFYWGENVKEFVSIQDYQLFLNNETILYERTFMPASNIRVRRQIWLSGGMSKNNNDDTDYEDINFAIGLYEPISLEGFKFIKKYNNLYLSKKIKN